MDILPDLPVYGTGNLFFGHRGPVASGVLMVGDSAGLIAPLAGDGIGIAVQQGRLIGRLFAEIHPAPEERESFCKRYRRDSTALFARRRRFALICQHIALSAAIPPGIVPLLAWTPGLLKTAIRFTRGDVRYQHIPELT